MNYSSQAIVVDWNYKFYLEDNKVIRSLSYIGWKLEEGEEHIDAIIRELQEELGIIFPPERFLWAELQPVRSFWNERKGKCIDWQSVYYVLVLDNEERAQISENIKLKIYTLTDLEGMDESNFPNKRKVDFISQLKRALTFV